MKASFYSLTALSGVAIALRWLASAAFFATLVLLPVRLRLTVLSRPIVPIPSDYTDYLVFAPDVAMLATLAFWGLFLLATRHRIQLGPLSLWVSLAGLTLAGCLSLLASVDRALTLYHVIRLSGLFLFYLYIVNEVAAPALVVPAVALQGLIQAVVAIPQFLSQRSIGLQAMGEHLLDPSWNGVSILSTGSSRVLRAYGLSDHPNILGGCLAFALILLLAHYLAAQWRTRLLLLIAFLPMSVALLLTFSRAAWLAFAACAAFLVATRMAFHCRALLKPSAWLSLAVVLALVPFLWQVSPLLGIRFNAQGTLNSIPAEEQSIGERLLLMQAGAHVFAAHPLTGIGLGGSPIAIRDQYPGFDTPYQPPHWTLLDAAMETGLAGGVFYLVLLLLPWVLILRHREKLADPAPAAAAALLLALTVVGFFDYYTWLLVPGRLWQWTSWGLVAATFRKAD